MNDWEVLLVIAVLSLWAADAVMRWLLR